MIDGITTAGVLGLLGASIVIIATPGPSVLFLIGRALARGRGTGLLSVLGNSVGFALVAVVVALGLSAIVARVGWLPLAIRIVGGLVLVLIGVGYLRARSAHLSAVPSRAATGPVPIRPASTGQAAPDQSALGWRRHGPFLTSVGVGVTNPKGVIMFGVIVPSFLAPGTVARPSALMLLSLVPLVVGLVLDSAWVLVAAAARSWFTSSSGRLVAVSRAGGVLIIVLGVLVLFGV